MSSIKCNDSLRDTVTLTPKILERIFYNHILRIKIIGRKKKRKQMMRKEGTRRKKRRWPHYKCTKMRFTVTIFQGPYVENSHQTI